MTNISITTDNLGNLAIRTQDGDNPPHRRVLTPGAIINGVWTPTDLSGEPAEVQAAAAEHWTPEVIAETKARAEAAHVPYVPPVPSEISDVQFALEWAARGVISYEEAAAFSGAGVIPAAFQAAIDAIPDPTERNIAIVKVSGLKTYQRNAALTNQLAAAFGLSPEQTDQFFRDAAQR